MGKKNKRLAIIIPLCIIGVELTIMVMDDIFNFFEITPHFKKITHNISSAKYILFLIILMIAFTMVAIIKKKISNRKHDDNSCNKI